jgi:hypothetical protein
MMLKHADEYKHLWIRNDGWICSHCANGFLHPWVTEIGTQWLCQIAALQDGERVVSEQIMFTYLRYKSWEEQSTTGLNKRLNTTSKSVDCRRIHLIVKQASENSIVQRMQGRRQSTRDAVECIPFIFNVHEMKQLTVYYDTCKFGR